MKKLIDKYFGGIEIAILSIFIVALPAIYSHKLLDAVLYSRQLVLSLVLLLIVAILCYKAIKGNVDLSFSKNERIYFGLALLFFLLHVISAFGAINGKETTFHTLKQGCFVLYLFVTYLLIRDSSLKKAVLIKSVILCSLFFLCIGVYQLTKADFSKFLNAQDHYGYYLTQALWDVKSTLANKNPFSSLLYLTLPFIVYGIYSFKRVWRVVSIATLILNIVFIVLMVSKTVWFAVVLFFIFGLMLLFLYLFYLMPKQSGRILPTWQKTLVIGLPTLLIIGGVLFISKSDTSIANVIKDKVLQIVNPDEQLDLKSKDNPSSMEMRVIAYGKTFEMIKDNPILGVGPGHWRICFPKYGLDEFGKSIRDGVQHFQRTHNDFLWIAAEVGLLGLIVYLVLFFTVLYFALINFIKCSGKDEKVLNGLILSSLLGYIAILAVSFSRERVPHNVMYLAMFALVLSDRFEGDGAKKKKVRKRVLFLGGAIMLFFSIFNSKVTADFYRGDKAAYAIAYFKDVRKNWRMVYRSASKVDNTFYTLDPFSTPIEYYKGSAQYKQNDISQAHKAFLKAYSVHPYHLLLLNNLGTSYNMLNEHDKAIEFYDKALAISPRYAEAIINIATVYYNKKESKKALSYLARLPYSKNQSERFNKAVVAICKQYVINGKFYTNYNKQAFVDWVQDDNKIIASFVKFSQGNVAFDKILAEELKK